MVEMIRVSEGTGEVIGLWDRKLAVKPETGYLMTYHEDGCRANCGFCPQARESDSGMDRLSRISWPKVEFGEFLQNLSENQKSLERICVQALNYPEVVSDIVEIVSKVRKLSNIPISVSCQPLSVEDMEKLYSKGVDRLGIPLDAATPEIFAAIKGRAGNGPYRWEKHIQTLEKATEIFGENVSTHLIVGLGEDDEEVIERIQYLHEKDITVGLFAFTPVSGSSMIEEEKPSIQRYRKIQLARHLIVNDIMNIDDMKFSNGSLTNLDIPVEKIKSTIYEGQPFLTSGCPGCNRPFYNESVSGPIYNFPRNPTEEELEEIIEQLKSGMDLE